MDGTVTRADCYVCKVTLILYSHTQQAIFNIILMSSFASLFYFFISFESDFLISFDDDLTF